MQQLVLLAAEVLCYSGAVLSAVIVLRLVTMENLSWLNKMFLLYFSLDCIFGTAETYLFFKLHRDRCLVSLSNSASCRYNQPVSISRCLQDSGLQIHNCVSFIFAWRLWSFNRQLCQSALVFCRCYMFISSKGNKLILETETVFRSILKVAVLFTSTQIYLRPPRLWAGEGGGAAAPHRLICLCHHLHDQQVSGSTINNKTILFLIQNHS